MRINTIFPGYPRAFGGLANGCQCIVQAMHESGVDVSLSCETVDDAIRQPFHRLVLPPWSKSIGFRLFSPSQLLRFTERKFKSEFGRNQRHGNEIAYIWPGPSLELFEWLRDHGYLIVTEAINTHQSFSKVILDAEYSRLRMVPAHTITEDSIADENAQLDLAGFVYCPSYEVSSSMQGAGVPHEKLICTSYGLRDADIVSAKIPSQRQNHEHLTAIFVGRIGVRKAAHLLLKYWVKSGIKGTLKLVGNIETDARPLINPYLNRPDVEHIPFTHNVKAVYETADLFILPSLEEGSPLVTYQALGAGLPCLVSPMGGGGIIEDGVEGLVNEPHDADAWVDAIRRIFTDHELRRSLGQNAYRKAPQYLWSNVGRQRLLLLQSRIAALRTTGDSR
jgi:glycosyltransferase involved in cell wall biosynthesis